MKLVCVPVGRFYWSIPSQSEREIGASYYDLFRCHTLARALIRGTQEG